MNNTSSIKLRSNTNVRRFRKRNKSRFRKASSGVAGTIKVQKSKRLYELYGILFKQEDLVPKFESSIRLTSDWFNKLIKHRGVIQGTKFFNDARLYTIKLLLGLPTPEVKTLSLHKDGFPSKLAHLKVFKDHDEYIKIVYTILSVSRFASSSSKSFELDSIRKQPPRDLNYFKELSDFKYALPSILKELKIPTRANPISVIGEKLIFHNTTKSGPNSTKGRGDALSSSHLDSLAIINDRKVKWSLDNYLTSIGRSDISQYIEKLASQYKDLYSNDLTCSRLAALPQPENKQRVVAIIDYFSQMALLPLHRYLFQITEKVPNTYVFNQDKGRELVKEFTEDSEALPQSFDASSFTDRFPMELQEIVLQELFDDQYARRTRHLLTNRDFEVPFSNKKVVYGAGQPMGAFSSFPLANLTHSLYVYWKLHQFGENPVTDSVVVGDDVAFRHLDDGSTSYQLGMEHLGVSFSKIKGYSSRSKSIRVAEFCKRLYVNGSCVSPISPKAATKAAKDYKFIAVLDDHLDDSSFNKILLRVDERWREEALMLFSLPSFITGTTLKVDQRNLSEETKHLFSSFNQDSIKNIGTQVFSSFVLEKIMERREAIKKLQSSLFKASNLEAVVKHLGACKQDQQLARVYNFLESDTQALAGFLAEASSKSGTLILDEGSQLHPLVCVAGNLLDLEEKVLKVPNLLPKPGGHNDFPLGPHCRLYSQLTSDNFEEFIDSIKNLAFDKERGLMPLPLEVRTTERKEHAARMQYVIGKRILSKMKEEKSFMKDYIPPDSIVKLINETFKKSD